MKGPNLSEWAISHRVLIFFFMALALVVGVFSYRNLGREEDPDFSVLTMLVAANWPGANVQDMMNNVTNTLEEKLEETPNIDYLKSYTEPGQTVIYVNLKDSTPASEVPAIWYQVRKKISDIKQNLPQGVQGPFFNDEFGDVFGIIYGLTFDGFTLRQARDMAESIRQKFLGGADVGKVDIYGTQDEKIYITFSPEKLAALNLSLDQVLSAIQQQNAVTPSGVINTSNENVLVEVSGALTDVASVAAINLYINNSFYNIAQLGTVSRGYIDPPTKMFRVNGKDALGIAVSMAVGGNNLEFGKSLDGIAAKIEEKLPIGLDLVRVSDQPEIVREAIGGFTDALFEAIIIVLVVSFVSLGFRAGLVVALSIPLVLAIVFLYMDATAISLQRISLGALVISLGLLVDDAMITIESMVSQIEEGVEKIIAAGYAYTSTAFPMLTGTVVTIFGFLPIGLSQSTVGQYCFSLFAVIGIALTASWFVAVIFAPVIGVTVLPNRIVPKHKGPGRIVRTFAAMLTTCMRYRWITIAVTLILFAMAVYGQGFIQRQFFPASDRNEVLVTLILPKNASIAATKTEVLKVEKLIDGDPDVVRYSSYSGGGAPRFYLPLDVQQDNDFTGQLVVVTQDLKARDRVLTKLKDELSTFDTLTARVSVLELGPPVGWPVQYRVTAQDIPGARTAAEQVAQALRQSGMVTTVNYDWNEESKAITININQDRARQVGLSSQDIANDLQTILTGADVTQVRDSIYLIDVVARATDENRLSVEGLRNLQIQIQNGASVPLSEIATLNYGLDESYVWRRDRMPTITVQADPIGGLQAPTVFERMAPTIAAIQAKLPDGSFIVSGGSVEKSNQSLGAVAQQIPLALALMLIVLMIDLQSVSRLLLVLSVAPLGLIGVVIALITTHTPMGFVAILGIIALTGMIVRNSVILIAQIKHNHDHGLADWDAVVEATKHRMRPILLTAAAAILGMIPIMKDVFWGPMAYAISGGLAGATLLTLLFLPALYVTWFNIKPPPRDAKAPALATATTTTTPPPAGLPEPVPAT